MLLESFRQNTESPRTHSVQLLQLRNGDSIELFQAHISRRSQSPCCGCSDTPW